MATAIQAATAFVTIRLERALFRRELDTANQQLNEVAASAARFGGALLTAGIVGTAALAKITKSASDAVEAANRFNQVFRAAGAGAASAWADSFASSVGRARTEVRDTLSTFQGFFVGLGFGADQAELFSRKLTEASVDFASFNNLADDDALRRFIGALSGSPETLDKFGFNVREAAVNAELLAMGIKKTTRTATEQQKAIAKMNIIMRTMGKLGATGDAIRTADEYANVLKRLGSEFRNLTETLGQEVIPQMKAAAQAMISVMKSTEDLTKAFPGLAQALGAVTVAMTAFGAAFLSTAVIVAAFNIVSAVGWIRALGAAIARALGPILAFGRGIGAIFAGMSTAGLTVIITGLIEMGRQIFLALGYWKDMKIAISEASEAQKKMLDMQDDRIQKNKENLEGGSPFVVKADEEKKRKAMMADLEKREKDYERRIENMEKNGRQRGGFFSEMFRQSTIGDLAEKGVPRFGSPENMERYKKLKEMYDKGGLDKLEAMSQGYYGSALDFSDAGNRSKFAYDKEELDREKENLRRTREQLARMRKDEADRKRADAVNTTPMTDDQIIANIKEGQKAVQKRSDSANTVRWMNRNIADKKKAEQDKAFAEGMDKLKEAAEIMRKGIIDELKKESDFNQGVWNQAAQELSTSQDRLREYNEQVTNQRGAFGSRTAGAVARTGGIFGMQDTKEQKELQLRIRAAKKVMDLIEQKYGNDWKQKVEADRARDMMFENLMKRFGVI